MRFYLGTHHPEWLGRVSVPLFVSHRTLSRYRGALPRARGPWVLDSGGFSELDERGSWATEEVLYRLWVRRYMDEVGKLEWIAPQDWMCEPRILARTGLTVAEHQRRTLASYLSLRSHALPVAPVLQGWEEDDYLRCVDLYERAGIDLTAEPVVGVGSVCRRQGTQEVTSVIRRLWGLRLRCHGFGVKVTGLAAYGHLLASADSMAWSRRARYARTSQPCPNGSASCANCLHYALAWRSTIVSTLEDAA